MTVKDVTVTSEQYDKRHGGPFDRGSADSYYHRGIRPHYYKGDTGTSEMIEPTPGSSEYKDYIAGYEFNEQCGDKKDWN